MKTLNHLFLAVTAAANFGAALSAQAKQPPTIAKAPQKAALFASPRYLEAHPELRWSSSPTEQLAKQNVSGSERQSARTFHKALAASPRFREQQPELLHEQPVFEIAPLK